MNFIYRAILSQLKLKIMSFSTTCLVFNEQWVEAKLNFVLPLEIYKIIIIILALIIIKNHNNVESIVMDTWTQSNTSIKGCWWVIVNTGQGPHYYYYYYYLTSEIPGLKVTMIYYGNKFGEDRWEVSCWLTTFLTLLKMMNYLYGNY